MVIKIGHRREDYQKLAYRSSPRTSRRRCPSDRLAQKSSGSILLPVQDGSWKLPPLWRSPDAIGLYSLLEVRPTLRAAQSFCQGRVRAPSS